MGCRKKVRLSDVAELTPGFAFKSTDFGEYSHKAIKITNISREGYSDAFPGVDIDAYPAGKLDKYLIGEGDYYLAMTGSIGKVGRLVRGSAYLNQRVLGLKAKSQIDADYLWFVLNSADFHRHLLTHIDSHSVQANISAESVGSFEFDLPPMNVQLRIGFVLGSFDKKIIANNRINGYLEELLVARYDELFAADNQEYDGTISDVGEVVGGATPSKKKAEYYTREGIGWITPRDLSNTTDKFISHGADDITQAGYNSCSARLMPAGTVLFSSRAPIGYIAIATDELATNQGFKSVVPKEDIGTAFVYCFLKRNKDRIADAGSGTTFPEVSGKTMKGIGLAVPDRSLCEKFSDWADPILRQQRLLEEENRRLGQLRDTILPKLMTGEIDLSSVK